MKKYKILLFLSVILMSLVSCETVDFEDTNENPNGPAEFDTGALLSGAQRRFLTFTGRSYLGDPNLYVQYRSQPVYQDPSRYAETPQDWSAYYVQTLANLQQIVNLSQDEEFISKPSYTANGSAANQIGLARIWKVLIFKRITDTYGDIPYFEALNPEIQSPAYTPQQEIYADFIKELQEARDMMEAGAVGPAGDLIYGGDVDAWKRFANTLLLNIAMQISDADPALAQATFNEALNNASGVIEEVGQEAWYIPVNVATLDNPWTSFRPADYNLSEFLMDALQGDAADYSSTVVDSRVNIFANNPTGDGLPYGLADYSGIGTDVKISLYVTSPTSPLPILTAGYTWLNRAEAAVKGWTSEDPAEALTNGITSSYESVSSYWGQGDHVDAAGLDVVDITADAAAFAAARVADAALVGFEQVIGEEKWVALFSQGFDSWSEFRRTDFPVLTPSPDPLNNGPIPTRYLYPNTEINLNNANYSAAVGRLTPAEDRNTSRIWWDKN